MKVKNRMDGRPDLRRMKTGGEDDDYLAITKLIYRLL
jgi:hypothetical protein